MFIQQFAAHGSVATKVARVCTCSDCLHGWLYLFSTFIPNHVYVLYFYLAMIRYKNVCGYLGVVGVYQIDITNPSSPVDYAQSQLQTDGQTHILHTVSSMKIDQVARFTTSIRPPSRPYRIHLSSISLALRDPTTFPLAARLKFAPNNPIAMLAC